MPPQESPERPDLLALGQAIRRRRATRQWTLDQLAAESGVSRRTVINAESGRHAIGVDNLIDLARALGVTAAQLLVEADE